MAASHHLSDAQMREHLDRLQEHTGTTVHPTGTLETGDGYTIPAVGHRFTVHTDNGLLLHNAHVWNEKQTHYNYTSVSDPRKDSAWARLHGPDYVKDVHVLRGGKIGANHPETEPQSVRKTRLTEFLNQHHHAEVDEINQRTQMSKAPHIADVHVFSSEGGKHKQRFNLKTGKFEE